MEPINKKVVEHPKHYNMYSVEAVEMARRIWGEEALKTTAEITAFFYRMRAGLKEGVPPEVDFDKERFWLEVLKTPSSSSTVINK